MTSCAVSLVAAAILPSLVGASLQLRVLSQRLALAPHVGRRRVCPLPRKAVDATYPSFFGGDAFRGTARLLSASSQPESTSHRRALPREPPLNPHSKPG